MTWSRRASSPATSRIRWPGSVWPTTSPRPPCSPTANSTTSQRISATTSNGCLPSTRSATRPSRTGSRRCSARRCAGAVLLRPGRPRRQHVKTPVRHRFSFLLQRRHLPAVERLRNLRQPGQDPGPDRADARRPQLHVGGPHRERRAARYGQPGKTFAIGLGCELRHAHRLVYSEGLDLSGKSPHRSARDAGSVSATTVRSAPSRRSGARSISTSIAARCPRTW